VIKLVSFIALKQGTKLLSSASDDTGFYRKWPLQARVTTLDSLMCWPVNILVYGGKPLCCGYI
jgi:hypothetical protein